jgi:DNA-binding transcriptional ArsR family regulator
VILTDRPGRSYITNQLSNREVLMVAAHRLDATFAALADPTRRAILARLGEGEATVTELAEPFAMTQPAISKHLRVLERAELISRRRDAQRRPCRLEPMPLREATGWLSDFHAFWGESFERLDGLLDELGRIDAHGAAPPPQGSPGVER